MNPPRLFLVSLGIATLLFFVNVFISNSLSTNEARIVCNSILAILALLGFVVGVIASLHSNDSKWATLNIISIVVIVGLTVWICLTMYALRNLSLG